MLDVGKWSIFNMADESIMASAQLLCVFGTGGNEAFIITNTDEIFALGSNLNGCLALSGQTLQVKKVEKLSKMNIVTFAFGSTPHVLALTESGQVYGWGGNSHSQVGMVSSSSVQEPTLIAGSLSGKTVANIACGSNHSLVLTSDGESPPGLPADNIWSPDGTFGPIWRPARCCFTRQASSLPEDWKLAYIVPEPASLLVCTMEQTRRNEIGQEKGMLWRNIKPFYCFQSCPKVFAWGFNNSGQIGSGSTLNQPSPRKVTASIGNKHIVGITCGQHSSMAIDDNGELYSWGYNGNGQLGVGSNTNQPNPCRVTGLIGTFVTQIVCGFAHSIALSDTANIYTWGANQNGQLGTGTKANLVTPARIAHDKGRFVEVTACHYSHMSSATTALGKVYVWGLCKGQSVTSLADTNFACADEAFACLSSSPAMSRPLTIGKTAETKTVADTVAMSFNDKETSDVAFVIDGNTIHVHKSFLKIRCEYFRAMFQSHWPEDGKNEIKVTTYSHAVYHAFLRYLYTDQVKLPPEEAIGLLDLANAYCEPQLKRLSEKIIKNGITIQNAIILLAAARKYDASDLEEFCFKFCVNHMTAITQTDAFQKLDEITLKDFIYKASMWGAFKY